MENTKIELFERHLANELVNEEFNSFQRRLVEDKTFREDYDDFKESVLLIESEGIRSELVVLMNKRNVKSSQYWWYFTVAASIMLVIAIVFIFQKGKSSEDLYIAYFEPYPIVTLRSQDINVGLEFYSDQNYKKVVEVLSIQKALTVEERLAFGIALLELNQIELSLDTFEFLRNDFSKNSFIYRTSQWYSSLCYLRKGEYDSVNQILNKIVNDPRHEYITEAYSLLDDLR